MRVSRYGFVCLVVLMFPLLAGRCTATPKPVGNYSYSFSVGEHSVSVCVKKAGDLSLKMDGKEGKKNKQGWVYVEIGKMAFGLIGDGSLSFDVGGDSDGVDISVLRAASYHSVIKNAAKIKAGGKTVLREKSTYGGDAESPVPCHDFYYFVREGGLVYQVSQSTPLKNKKMTKEFREVVETLKIGRAGK